MSVTYTLREARGGQIVAAGDNFRLENVETTRSLTTFDKVTGWIRHPEMFDDRGVFHPLTKTLTAAEGDTITFFGFLAETALTRDGVRYVFHSWRDYLAHVVHGRAASFVDADVAHIIRDLWLEALDYDSAPENVSVTATASPWPAGTKEQPVTAGWDQGTNVGQLVTQLSAAGIVQTEYYDVTAAGDPACTVHIAPHTVTDDNATFDESNTVTAFNVELKPEHCPSALLVLGAGQGPTRLVADIVSSSRDDRLRNSRVVNASTGMDKPSLERLGATHMRRSENPLPVRTIEVLRDSPQAPPDTYTPGSVITLRGHGLSWRAEVVAVTTKTTAPDTAIVELRQT